MSATCNQTFIWEFQVGCNPYSICAIAPSLDTARDKILQQINLIRHTGPSADDSIIHHECVSAIHIRGPYTIQIYEIRWVRIFETDPVNGNFNCIEYDSIESMIRESAPTKIMNQSVEVFIFSALDG
jgi:hypothetical protein